MNNQKQAFLNYEADSWFDRNKSVIENFDTKDDIVIDVLKRYNLSPKQVLEIGSCAGYRLNGIREEFAGSKVYGVDPSSKAIEYGHENYSDVNLTVATADELPFGKNMFDVVIVGFVFYVVDRELLFKSIAEIDRVLQNNGFLLIIDFFSEKALRNQYAHISEFNAYAFKQKYEDIFISSQLYHLIDKTTFNHSEKINDAKSDFYDLISVTMLKKNINASYK